MKADAELLGQYAAEKAEAAFAELTRRHVDLVYSAALRILNGDIHSAQDVAQQVFTELARQAARLARHPALVGWLYTTTRLMALRVQRTEQRRAAREQEANHMNELVHEDSPAADWSQLSPVIEEALHELGETDRNAILLRYFQNKSLQEVGAGLNLAENAARMRVDRALEKLRGKLAQRGITTTAAALAVAVSANAVQAAPAGFAAAVSAGAVAGSAAPVSTLIVATKTIAMTTFQKTTIAAALALAAGTGLYAVHQRSELRRQIQTLEQERTPLQAQVQQLEQDRSHAAQRLAALQEENARLKAGQDAAELLKLRGQVGVLRQQAATNGAKSATPTSGLAKMLSDPAMKEYLRQAQREKIRSWYADLFKEQKLTQEQVDQFLEVFTDAASKGLAKYTGTQGGAEQAPAEPGTDLASQVRALLGEAGYTRYQEYSDEIPARITLSLLNTQLGDTPLSSEQSARLLGVVKAEPRELTLGVTGAPDQAFLGSQADADAFLGRVADSNERILQQSSTFLTGEQQAALEVVLTKAIDTRKLQAAALIQKH